LMSVKLQHSLDPMYARERERDGLRTHTLCDRLLPHARDPGRKIDLRGAPRAGRDRQREQRAEDGDWRSCATGHATTGLEAGERMPAAAASHATRCVVLATGLEAMSNDDARVSPGHPRGTRLRPRAQPVAPGPRTPRRPRRPRYRCWMWPCGARRSE